MKKVILLLLLLVACQVQPQVKGVLEGKIGIGPICPVERIPPDPSCQPTPEMYKAWPLEISQKGKKVATVVANDGTFSVELAPGTYVVDLERKQGIGGGKSLPATIVIKSGETTTLDIDIDTGIR